ncbi:MAG TPA: SRPBCC domain-containing protein [Thermoanaerobaculia bacterium]|nr:SRPBCC domain-containing protein [Thermoanaerobaculia bacterium]
MTTVDQRLEPIKLAVNVPLNRERAFALFTERIDTWWPFGDFAVDGPNIDTCFVEPRAGGRICERSKDGTEHVWADVVVFERPRKIVVSWHPGKSVATELEITFTPSDRGTFVELEHRGWEAFADLAAEARSEYTQGWAVVIADRFVAAAEADAKTGGAHE